MSRQFQSGVFIAFFDAATRRLFYGRINAVNGGNLFVEIALDVFIMVSEEHARVVPNRNIAEASAEFDTKSAANAISTFIKSIPVMVTVAAAQGLSGGAATMNGLATIGLGSASTGILFLSGAPAMMASASLAQLANAIENDKVTADIVKIAGVSGVLLGSAASIAAVSSCGAVAGLSGAGITSGYTALGSGSIVSAVGGLITIAAVVVVGVGWYTVSSYRQQQLEREFERQQQLEREFDEFVKLCGSLGIIVDSSINLPYSL